VDDLRWTVYDEIKERRFAYTDEEWTARLRRPAQRVAELRAWSSERSAPERWRLLEAWTIAAHGPYMAVAGGFRLAFWAEDAAHHGPRLDRALARYERFADARPPGWPCGAVAGFTTFLIAATSPQQGPEHGMAYDVARFNELTKRMSAYAHYLREDHLDRAQARAARRQRTRALAEQINQRLSFRIAGFARDDDRADSALKPDSARLHVGDLKVVLDQVLIGDLLGVDLGCASCYVVQHHPQAIGNGIRPRYARNPQ